jgi:hypothetical protein
VAPVLDLLFEALPTTSRPGLEGYWQHKPAETTGPASGELPIQLAYKQAATLG